MDRGPFERLLVDLARADVRFLVVGGMACLFNGLIRVTETVDLLIDAEPDNVQRLLSVLERFGDGHARELSVSDFGDEAGAVRLIEDFPIDMFTRMGGRRYADMLRYRRVLDAAAHVPYVDAEGLVLLEQGNLRERD
jgi:hypothetical protein